MPSIDDENPPCLAEMTQSPIDRASLQSGFHERTRILIDDAGLAKLSRSRVLVAGLGGVGGMVAEALVRGGIGHLVLLDHDVVGASNLNRQLIATVSTMGRLKTEAMRERLLSINPDVQLTEWPEFLYPEQARVWLQKIELDYVADCIDSIACKAALVVAAQEESVPVISSMGAGGRLDPTRVQVTNLSQTYGCGLAREMRKALRRLGGRLDYPVIFSDEPQIKGLAHQAVEGGGRARAVNGTISYLPALFGLMLAGMVIQSLLKAD